MSDFQTYLQNRPGHHQRLVEWGLENEVQDRFEFISPSKKKRILNSLLETKNYLLHEKIKLCYSTKRKTYYVGKNACGNIYCPSCRNWQAYIHQSNVRSRVKEAQIAIITKPNNNVLLDHKTSIFDSYVEPSNDSHNQITGIIGLAQPDVSSVKQMLEGDKNTWNKIRRNINKTKDRPMWVEVAYEFELVNWRYLELAQASDYKKKQIEQIRKSQAFTDDLFVLVHFHGVTNLTKGEITSTFKDYYFFGGEPLIKHNQENGLYVQSLHETQPFFTNIQKVTSYPFKQALRFKHSFIGSDHVSGEPFTPEELSFMIKLYDEIKGQSLFRSATNGLKSWNRLETVVDQAIQQAQATKNQTFITQCLPHLAKIKSSILKQRNAPERLASCVKAMKSLANLYLDQDHSLSTLSERWFHQHYELLFYVIRNLSHSYVKPTTVTRTVERLKKQRLKNLIKTQNSVRM
mgnify:CR=1 FL=1